MVIPLAGKKVSRFIAFVAGFLGITSQVFASGQSPREEQEIRLSRYTSGVSVHDPSMIEVDGNYYIFGSHMEVARTDNLRTWSRVER
jgi:arabinan endo-1,5-alpha-L-arabinosidase